MNLGPDVLRKLETPFDPEDIEWRPGSKNRDKTSALALGYTNARVYMDRLHDAAGGEWNDEYNVQILPDRIVVVCTLFVCGVGRTDVGEELLEKRVWNRDDRKYELKPNENAVTTASAQAFKRACTKFGLGAFFYKLPSLWGDLKDGGYAFKEESLRSLNSNLRSWVAANYPDTLEEMTMEEALAVKTTQGTPFEELKDDQLQFIIDNEEGKIDPRRVKAAELVLGDRIE